MKERELETKSAGYYAFAASRDARMKATAMWSHYSETQKVQAERMKLGLELCYSAKGIYVNPRKKFIAIKIDNPTIKDRKNLALLEQDYEKAGITKVVSNQGVTYRIAKV
jgi:hypothetical protein